MKDIELWLGDCLELMDNIPDNSVDMILADLPYGTTKEKWDIVIPFEPLWEQYNRIKKINSPVILFGRNPFFAKLILSNEKSFKYEIIWDKNAATDFAGANMKPITVHENLAVFCDGKISYNRINDEGFKPYSDKRKTKMSSNMGAVGLIKREPFENRTSRTPTTIRRYFPDNRKGLGSSLHPTQKPVSLLDWIINSYSKENELILDNTMGSGSCGVSAKKNGRKFIGIEKEEKYYNIAVERLR